MIGIPHFPVSQNHYHLVVRVDQARARGWTMHEVAERWTLLFARPPLIERWEQDSCDEPRGCNRQRSELERRHRCLHFLPWRILRSRGFRLHCRTIWRWSIGPAGRVDAEDHAAPESGRPGLSMRPATSSVAHWVNSTICDCTPRRLGSRGFTDCGAPNRCIAPEARPLGSPSNYTAPPAPPALMSRQQGDQADERLAWVTHAGSLGVHAG